MRLAEIMVTVVLIMLGGIYTYGILQIHGREFTSNEIGPTAFPWLLVSLLVFLSVLILIRQRFATSIRDDVISEESGATTWKTLVVALLLIAYVAVLDLVGFLWATPIFLALVSPLYGAHRLSLFAIAGMSIGFTAALHSILWFVFGVLLP